MPEYVVAVLAPRHERDAFSCGEPTLDSYLKQRANQDMKRGLAVCYALTERGGNDVRGYYTLSATSVDLSSLPENLRRRSGTYPVVPAVLLGRLAVDNTLRGGGFGAALLADALQRAARTGVGVKLVVVDALNETAAAFYERFGFQRFEDAPMRLFLPVAAVTDLLSVSPLASEDTGDH